MALNAAECVQRGLLLIFAPIFTGEVLASRSSFHTYRVIQISGASSVFTLPAPIADLAYQNKAELYGVLFDVAAEVLQIIAADCKHLNFRRHFLPISTSRW